MTVHQLVDFIIANPTLLKRPIILNDYELQVGFNSDDITIFLPPEFREKECDFCKPVSGCEYIKNLKIYEDDEE